MQVLCRQVEGQVAIVHPTQPQGSTDPALPSRTSRTDLIGPCSQWSLRYMSTYFCPLPLALQPPALGPCPIALGPTPCLPYGLSPATMSDISSFLPCALNPTYVSSQAHCRALLEAEGTLQNVPSAAASAYQLGPGICHSCC